MLYSNDEFFGYRSIPINIHQEVIKNLTAKTSAFILTSPTLTVNHSFEYIRQEFQIDDSIDSKILTTPYAPEELSIYIPDHLVSPTNKKYPQQSTELVDEMLQKFQGNTFMIFSSRKAVETTHHELAPKLKKLGIQLHAENISGSRGKILEKMKHNPEKTILFGSIKFWKSLKISEVPIKHLILQKIPFDPPKIPVIAAKSALLENSFADYQLPRAIIKLRRIIHQLSLSKSQNKTLTILDTRILNQEYGETILNSLEVAKIEKQTPTT